MSVSVFSDTTLVKDHLQLLEDVEEALRDVDEDRRYACMCLGKPCTCDSLEGRIVVMRRELVKLLLTPSVKT